MCLWWAIYSIYSQSLEVTSSWGTIPTGTSWNPYSDVEIDLPHGLNTAPGVWLNVNARNLRVRFRPYAEWGTGQSEPSEMWANNGSSTKVHACRGVSPVRVNCLNNETKKMQGMSSPLWLDVTIFNPRAKTTGERSIPRMYTSHENEKNTEFLPRILQVEKEIFTSACYLEVTKLVAG